MYLRFNFTERAKIQDLRIYDEFCRSRVRSVRIHVQHYDLIDF
jgi:hypothetical protein